MSQKDGCFSYFLGWGIGTKYQPMRRDSTSLSVVRRPLRRDQRRADEPHEKLKRALRAKVDEAAWASLYSTVSRAFERPKSGKIAVKAINHYGDEVLKVFPV
jgi:hypothetical protein